MTQTGDDNRFDATFADPGAIAKSCSRCARSFGCGRALPSCWCSDLPHLPAARIDPDTDCLCPACLAALTAEHAATRDT